MPPADEEEDLVSEVGVNMGGHEEGGAEGGSERPGV